MPYRRRYKRKKKKTRKRGFLKKRNATILCDPFNLDSTKPDITVCMRNPEGLKIANLNGFEVKAFYLFSLNNCINYNNWTAIYDYYRINWVKVHFLPIRTTRMNLGVANANPALMETPKFAVSLDRDSNSNPTDYSDVIERYPHKETLATQSQTWTFRPNRLLEVYRSPTTTGYKIDRDWRGFLDCAQSDIPHYGLRVCMANSTAVDFAFQYEVRILYNVSFRGRRN